MSYFISIKFYKFIFTKKKWLFNDILIFKYLEKKVITIDNFDNKKFLIIKIIFIIKSLFIELLDQRFKFLYFDLERKKKYNKFNLYFNQKLFYLF